MKVRKRGSNVRYAIGLSTVLIMGSLAACSSAGGSDGSATGATKGDPIEVLQTGTVDSPILSVPGTQIGGEVAVAAINAAGGINGRPLKVEFCDDKSNPSLASQCVQKAMSNGAVARVGGYGVNGNTILPILDNASMADFGGYPATPVENSNRVSFPLAAGANIYAGFGGLAKAMHSDAQKYLVVNSVLNGVEKRIEIVDKSMQAAGLERLSGVTVPSNTADLSSIVGQIKRADPDIVIGLLSPSDLTKYWSAANALGLTKPLMTQTSGLTPDVLKTAGSGLAWTSFATGYPSYNGSAPGAADFRSQMAKYAPGKELTLDAWGPWVAMNALASILRSMSGPINSETVLAAVKGTNCLNAAYLKCLDLSKPGPLSDSPALRVGTVYLLTAKDGQFYPTDFSASIFPGSK
ncbi:ABC transporter substrate-binding protein [Dactylosporangium sp. CA-092794]|uniref:ABC transporter substrate-binding protein n=1 Tax=Dactylosporangium sp. CA-092794 TaxID=3239929 RepID=UPI003D91BE4E